MVTESTAARLQSLNWERGERNIGGENQSENTLNKSKIYLFQFIILYIQVERNLSYVASRGK